MKKRTIWFLLICLSGLAAGLVFWWPHDAEYYFNRGQERLGPTDEDGDGDEAGALADFNRAIRLKPDFAAAYRARAGLEDDDRALADYSRAIEIDPRDRFNYDSRSRFWEYRGQLGKAMADLDKAIEFNPRNEMLYSRRAQLNYKRGDWRGMVADRERASEVFPPATEEQLRLLDRLRSTGSLPGGQPEQLLLRLVRLYDRAIAGDPDFYRGYYHRGVLKSLANDPGGALVDFRECAGFPDARLKDYAAIHTWLVRTRQGETNEANRELAVYLDTRTNGAPHDWEAQIARFLLGQIGEPDFSAAIGSTDVEWKRSQFWYYLAMKELLAGDKAKAADYFRKSRSTETRPYAVMISSQIELSRLGQ